VWQGRSVWTRRDLPELSDLIVDYDPTTLDRRDVTRRRVLVGLTSAAPSAAMRVVRRLTDRDGVLDRAVVDGVLVRAHLELQRLHEEFRLAPMIRDLLAPMIELARRTTGDRHIRVVDLGCGLGFVVRWLAARGGLGSDVELIGADYNRVLVDAAQRLADEERLACRFVAGNAFALREPAHLVISTGVLHHFRDADLVAVFAQHERSRAVGFCHVDIRPSLVAPLGSWIFHRARMREPLAQFDGVQSVVRAHPLETLREAAAGSAPGFALGAIDARPGAAGLLRIFHTILGVRGADRERLGAAYAPLGRRFELV
jgi:SAM-dependent methyltransferase